MQVKIKKLYPSAVIPKYAKPFDAALDLTTTGIKSETHDYIEFGTGLAFEIPEGFVGLVFPRSSITNKDMMLKNSVGVIDSSYRGEVTLRFKEFETGDCSSRYKVGDRIGQILIIPRPEIEFIEVTELSETERGEKGYGSTDK